MCKTERGKERKTGCKGKSQKKEVMKNKMKDKMKKESPTMEKVD